MIKNICLIIFALIGPITLPAGGIQKSVNQFNFLNNTEEIILISNISLYSYPFKNARKLMAVDAGTSMTILRYWQVNEREPWVRVELATNRILEDPNKIIKGWIKM